MSNDVVNPYELLAISIESTEQEIRTAYRQRSLKVHPDRNPNNPDAARKFHELNQAYELLLDPLRRLALDAKLRLKLARAERYRTYDAKRKNLVEELEERERAFKKARMEKQKEEMEQSQTIERIKEESRRLKDAKEKEMKQRQADAIREQEDEDVPPALNPLDTIVRIKFTLKTHPDLTTPSAIANLFASFGSTDIESIVIKPSKSKKASDDGSKPPKFGTALVPFKQIADAFAAVCASGRKERGLLGIEVGWIGGKEPLILAWLKKMGKLGTAPVVAISNGSREIKAELPQMQTTSATSNFSSFPSALPTNIPLPGEFSQGASLQGIDYESLTMMRLRQAERERLEREIREQEAKE